MRPWTSLPRPLLYFLADVSCLSTSLYASLWKYDVRFAVNYPVETGFNRSRATTFDSSSSCISVYSVEHGSPADQAGLVPGDKIVGVNGKLLISLDPFEYHWTHLHAIFRATNPDKPNEDILLASVRYRARFFPAFFLLVGVAPGDLFVIYTDGVTKANDASGNECGEARLVILVRANLTLSPAQLITQIRSAVMSLVPTVNSTTSL